MGEDADVGVNPIVYMIVNNDTDNLGGILYEQLARFGKFETLGHESARSAVHGRADD
ncbi:MAG: hypothetical protein ABI277_02800 [Burkholderiaceae bacterium]